MLFPGLSGRDPWAEQAGWPRKEPTWWLERSKWLLGCHAFPSFFLWALQAAEAHLLVSLSAGSPFALDLREDGRPTTGTSRGTGSCQVGVSGTAACIRWAWAPSRQGCSRYRCGKGSRATPCPWGHLALQPQPFPFLHSLNLRQESSFFPFLSHSMLEFCCLMHTGPASGYPRWQVPAPGG